MIVRGFADRGSAGDVIIVSNIEDVQFLQQNDDFTTVLKAVLRVLKVINTSCCRTMCDVR